jgi:hypothetical protein
LYQQPTKKIILYGAVLAALLVCVMWIFDLRFTKERSLNAIGLNAKIVQSADTLLGPAVLFESNAPDYLGVAQFRRIGGLFWRLQGLTANQIYDSSQPFHASSLGVGQKQTSQFIVGIKVQVPTIQHLFVGCPSPCNHTVPQGLTLEQVSRQPEHYKKLELRDGYAMYVADRYSPAGWTILAFDVDGHLVAYKPYTSTPIWVRQQ